jgi:hypothetical protein
MIHRSGRFAKTTRGLLAGATMLTALTISLGVAESSSSGSSAFCNTIITFYEQDAKEITPPTTMTAYRAWAAELVPFYEKLASEAPNAASKTTLGDVVVILKWESKKQSISSLEVYIAKNHAKFEAGTKALGNAIKSCG